jgi:type VI protein secretion system component Hcp
MSEIIESVKPTELTPSELDLVSGGVSLNFSKIEMSYVPQNADGTGSQESHK